MESKCSRQSLRNEDRLSHLPNALLLKILSSLPTKNVVATSVLSKQWRHLWKMVPKLEFTYQPTGGFYLANNLDLQRFSDIVRRSMLSLQAPVQSLHLNVIAGGCDYGFNFGVLVGIALGLHVRELVLHFELSHSFRFPISHCETLETLKLRSRRHSIILHVPSPVCLESLRTLHLEDVLYEDDESVRNLLSGCISLENLVVSRSGRDRVETFTVAVPSLQRLIITEVGYGDSVYVINAPSLKYLEILSEDRVPNIQWKEPKHVPQCLLHLKTVDWYVHGMGYGKEAAEYILRNLKKAVLRLEIADLTTFTEEERHEVQSAMERWCPDDCEFELVA